MKKILIAMLAAFLCMAMFAVSASAAEADVVYTLSSERAYPGGTVEITISVDSSAVGNTYAIADFTYDSDVFEFAGFSDFEEAVEEKIALTGMQPDSDKMAIAVPLSEEIEFNGNICTMTFKVDENAEFGDYEISATTLVAKNGSSELEVAVVPATVTVGVQTVPVEEISLNKATAYVDVDSKTALVATLTPGDTTETSITWTSSDEEVATVDEDGVVTALAEGSTTITATAQNGTTASCEVFVGVFADAVKFSSVKNTSLAIGKTMSFKASAYRKDGVKPESTKVVYEIVSGEEYASIDAKGKLTALEFGEVTVRARAEAGAETAYADIVIRVCIPAKKVTINKTKAGMALGYGDLELSATLLDETNTDTLTWTVDKPEIATVDENGVVTAHAVGKAKVTALAGSGKKATCTVTVGEVPATKVDISGIKATSVSPGKSISLKAKAARDDKTKPVSTAVNYEIIDGEEYAAIDAKGKLVAGEAEGEVVIRISAEAGTEDAYEEVTFRVCTGLATKVTLNKTKAAMALGYGELELSATLLDETNTDTLTWTVDKPEIATVDENGVVTAHAVGKAKVTALAGSGKKATCTVTVGEVPATKVDISGIKATSVSPGKSISLKAKAARDDKTKPVSTAVNYEIIDGEEYAAIDAKGKLVAGEAEGEVVIRISAEAGTEDAYEEVTFRVCTGLATKVTLNKTKAAMALGYGELELSATMISKEEICEDTLTWTVDKPEIVTVDENGVVTAHTVGKAKVTAMAGSGKKATCTVTVGEIPATDVDISSIKVTSVAVGKSITLKGKALREDGEKPVSTAVNIEILEGDEFATIDAKGKLTGISEGEVLVRISAEAGTDEAYKDVVIRVCTPATKVTLNMTKATVALSDGELQLEAVMLPEESTDSLKWTSANEEIATVDENGLVTVHSAGTVKITAIAGSGKSAYCTVTVTE